MENKLEPMYAVTYAIADHSLHCGVLGSFNNPFAAKKFKEKAEMELKNSGLEGTINMDVCRPGDTQTLIKFFEEF